MGARNYLIDGASGTGKTSVATELERRGFEVFHGDRMLAYRGDPETGNPVKVINDVRFISQHHIWNVEKVRALVADKSGPVSFFCGGSRNSHRFIDLFDEVFILELDIEALHLRLDGRPNEWGSTPEERALIVQMHAAKEGLPATGVTIDASPPLAQVVDEILRRCGLQSEQKPTGDAA